MEEQQFNRSKENTGGDREAVTEGKKTARDQKKYREIFFT